MKNLRQQLKSGAAVLLVLTLGAATFAQKLTNSALIKKYNEAKMLYGQAEDLRKQGTANAMRAALEKFAAAQTLFAQTKSKSDEAVCFNRMGFVSNALDEKQKALEFSNQALPLYRAVGDKNGESAALNQIGSVYENLGEKQKALEFYNQALEIIRVVRRQIGRSHSAQQHRQGLFRVWRQAKSSEEFSICAVAP